MQKDHFPHTEPEPWLLDLYFTLKKKGRKVEITRIGEKSVIVQFDTPRLNPPRPQTENPIHDRT